AANAPPRLPGIARYGLRLSKPSALSFIHFKAFPLPDTLFALNLFLFIDFYNIVIICYNSSLLV
ncbi:MAG: hypothetical protein PHE03_04120, partial [Bacteroidales bacterium]|nr:hypothetical protein [Bacteroidales bacterium]